MKNNKKTVAVALSGGVDSGASAYILKEQGFNVFGITMKLFDGFDGSGAAYVAEKLGIEHYVADYRQHFKREVIDRFVAEYIEGKTPNPCIMCNISLKYGMLLQEAKGLGADFLATGHYARVEYWENDKKYHLLKGNAGRKDQSYYLYHLNQDKLSSLIFPLSSYENKDEVRSLVREIIPATSEKKDSQNICFIQGSSHGAYIKKQLGAINNSGCFVDKNGRFLGRHKGIYNYTIGQKRNLGIKSDKPMFVIQINPKTNEIVLGEDKDTYMDEITVDNVLYTDEGRKNLESFTCQVKLCQWGYFIGCTVYNLEEGKALVKFRKSERAPAGGQSAVFYNNDEVLGGGIINFS